MDNHMHSFFDYFCYNQYLDMVHNAELELRDEFEITVGDGKKDKKRTETFIKMFKESGYQVRMKTTNYVDCNRPLYSIVVKCKYEYEFDHLTGDMYALMDTRTGQVVNFDRGGRKELAVYITPEEAKGKFGLGSKEVAEFGKEHIRLITLKMDKNITE